MKKILILIFSIIVLANTLSAQVLVTEDYAISSLIQKHIDQNKMSIYISGWRIQLLATTDRRKVEREEAKFMQEHPMLRVDWEHSKPYYKLKAGAFATKLEATPTLKELKKSYPSALLTKSNISINEILSN